MRWVKGIDIEWVAYPVTPYAPTTTCGTRASSAAAVVERSAQNGGFPHANMAPLACRCYRAHSANFLFFLSPFALFPLAFWWPSFAPFQYYCTIILYCIPDRCCCMHAGIVTAFPRLDYSIWYAMHWQVPRGFMGVEVCRPQSVPL